MKSKILMIPVWYPTEKNPIAGIFFKEQMEILSSVYDFTVLVITQKNTLIYKKDCVASYIKKDGVEEYHIELYTSVFLKLLYKLEGIFIQRKKQELGIGEYYSERYKKRQKRTIEKIASMLNLDYDLVYGISAQGIAYYAKILADLKKKTLVLGEHAPFPSPGTTVSDVLKESLQDADVFFAISNDKIRQVMLQNIKLKKICYVGNYVDEDVFEYKPIVHEKKTILIVAAHSFYKNYDMFIETIHLLKEKTNSPFNVIIAGYDANKEYCKDVDDFENRIRKSNFADCVELIKKVDRKDMPELYNRADVFVMTSIQEGQPVSAIEAGCCGLPIFSTRCGGVEDYVTEKVGRIVDITDSEKLSEYLRQFIEGEISFDNEVIRDTIVSKFGKKAFVSNITTCFDQLINN